MWLLFAVGSAVFAGVTAILAKCGLKNTDSDVATALRTGVVLLFAWLMVWITGAGSGIGHVSPLSLLLLVLSGLATGGSWLFYFKALQAGDVNKVAPVDKSSTVLTMLLAMLFLGEPVTLFKIAGILLIGTGTYLMIAKQPVSGVEAKGGPWFLYAALSAVFASLTAILGKLGMQEIDSNLGTALRTGVVLILAWAVVFAQRKQGQIKTLDAKSWWFLMLSGIATGASWLCYYRALQLGQVSLVAPIDKLSILVTVLFSSLFLKERLSFKAAVGLVLITGGTLILLVNPAI